LKRVADSPRSSQKRARTERDGQLVEKDGEDTVTNDRNVDQSDPFSNPSRASPKIRNRTIHKDHGRVVGQLVNDLDNDLDAEVGDNMPVSLFYYFMTLIDFRSKTFLILALRIQ
jgi:hypothetical protein